MVSPGLPVRGSAILADINSALSSSGFDGLRALIEQLAGMKDLPRRAAFSHPLDPGYINLLSYMAIQIDTAIEQGELSILDAGIDCFSKLLDFICQGKPGLWIDGRARLSDVAPTRTMYIQVLRGSPISFWPNYLYIFNLAYPSASPLWIFWLEEEVRTNPGKQWLGEIFLRHLSRGNECRIHSWHVRNEFLTRTLRQLVYSCCSFTCRFISTGALCDPPTISILDEFLITCLGYYARTFRSYDPTKLLRDGGPVYAILNEVNNYLRLNNNADGDVMCAIKRTRDELINVCMTYLKLWEAIPLLEAQLLEVQSVNDPARHYYRTSFAVNALRPATVASWRGGQALYLFAESNDETMKFFFQRPSSTRLQSITLLWADIPYYEDEMAFDCHNVHLNAKGAAIPGARSPFR
jgi:hypothetical protein